MPDLKELLIAAIDEADQTGDYITTGELRVLGDDIMYAMCELLDEGRIVGLSDNRWRLPTKEEDEMQDLLEDLGLDHLSNPTGEDP